MSSASPAESKTQSEHSQLEIEPQNITADLDNETISKTSNLATLTSNDNAIPPAANVSEVSMSDVHSGINEPATSKQPMTELTLEVSELADTPNKTLPDAIQNETIAEEAVADVEPMECDDDGDESDGSDCDRLVIDAPEPETEVDALSRLESALLVAAAAAEQHSTHNAQPMGETCTHETRAKPVETPAQNVEIRADCFKTRANIVESVEKDAEFSEDRMLKVKPRAESVETCEDSLDAHVGSVESSGETVESRSQSVELRANSVQLGADSVETLPTVVCLDSDESSSRSVDIPPKRKPGRKKKKPVDKANATQTAFNDDAEPEKPSDATALELKRATNKALRNLANFKDIDWLKVLSLQCGESRLCAARLALAEALRLFPAVWRNTTRCYSKLKRRDGLAALSRALGVPTSRLHRLVSHLHHHYYTSGSRTTLGLVAQCTVTQARPDEAEYCARLVHWLDVHFPPAWRHWELTALTLRQLTANPPARYTLSQVRFVIPLEHMARMFVHAAHPRDATLHFTPELHSRAKRLLLSWPLGRALVTSPAWMTSRQHPAGSPFVSTARKLPTHYKSDSAFHVMVPAELPEPRVYTTHNPEVLPRSLRECGEAWLQVMDEYMPRDNNHYSTTAQLVRGETEGGGGGRPASEVANEFLIDVAMAARGGLRPPALSDLARRYNKPHREIARIWRVWSWCVCGAGVSLWARGDDVTRCELRAADWLALDVAVMDETSPVCPVLHQRSLSSYECVVALSLLTRLCVVYNVESDPDGFYAVHHVYLSQGRVSSLVVLQRRWWELKRLAAARPAAALTDRHPILQAILKRFPHVLTTPLPEWSALVRDQKILHNNVMYYEEKPWLRSRMPEKYKHIDASLDNPFADLGEEDDIMIVENEIETIEVDDDCDQHNDTNSYRRDVKNERDNDMEQDDLLYQDVEETADIQTKVILDSDSESIDNDPPPLLEVSNTELDIEINDLSKTLASEILGSEPIEVEPIENVIQESIPEESNHLFLSSEKELRDELLKAIDININVDDNSNSASARSVCGNSAVSQVSDQDDSSRDSSHEAASSRSENATPADIDPKLVMIPVVNLTALHFIPAWAKYSRRRKISLAYLDIEELYDDHFKNIIKKKKLENDKPQETPHDKHTNIRTYINPRHKIKDNKESLTEKPTTIIESHLDETKSEILKLSKQVLIELDLENSNQAKDNNSTEIVSMPVTVNPSERPKKVYLNMSKTRRYTSMILRKNPDFNTNLKKISSEFWLSDRNRILMNKCLPVTIDLVKLELHKSPIVKLCEQPKGRVTKKIELPDINDVRRINRNILTAAVNPINVRSLQREDANKEREVITETPEASPVEPVAVQPPSRPPSPPPSTPAGDDCPPADLEKLLLSLQGQAGGGGARGAGGATSACCAARRWLRVETARRRTYWRAHGRAPPAPPPVYTCAHPAHACRCCAACLHDAAAPAPHPHPHLHAARHRLHQDVYRLLGHDQTDIVPPKQVYGKPKGPPASTSTRQEDNLNKKAPSHPCRVDELKGHLKEKGKEKYQEKLTDKRDETSQEPRTGNYHKTYKHKSKKKSKRETKRPDPVRESETETSEPADQGLEEWIREKNKGRALFGVYPPKRKVVAPPPPPPPRSDVTDSASTSTIQPHSICFKDKQQHKLYRLNITLQETNTEQESITNEDLSSYVQVAPRKFVKLNPDRSVVQSDTEPHDEPAPEMLLNKYKTRNINPALHQKGAINVCERNIFDRSVSRRQVAAASDVGVTRSDVGVTRSAVIGVSDAVEVSGSDSESVTWLDDADAASDSDAERTHLQGTTPGPVTVVHSMRDDAQNSDITEPEQKFINIFDRDSLNTIDNPISVKILNDNASIPSNSTFSNISDFSVAYDKDITDSNVTDSNITESNVTESAFTEKRTVNYVFVNESGSKIPCEFVDGNTALLRRGNKHVAIDIESIATGSEARGGAEHAPWTIDLTDDADDSTSNDTDPAWPAECSTPRRNNDTAGNKKDNGMSLLQPLQTGVGHKDPPRPRLKPSKITLDPAVQAERTRAMKHKIREAYKKRFENKRTVSVTQLMSRLAPYPLKEAWFVAQRRQLHALLLPVTAADIIAQHKQNLTDVKLLQTESHVMEYYMVRGAWVVVTPRVRDVTPPPSRLVLWRRAPRAAMLTETDGTEPETQCASAAVPQSAPRRVTVRDALYYKLSDAPLLYAQVVSALPDMDAVVQAVTSLWPLSLYHAALGTLVPLRTDLHGRLHLDDTLLDRVARRLESDGLQVSLAVFELNRRVAICNSGSSTRTVVESPPGSRKGEIIMETSIVPADPRFITQLSARGVTGRPTGEDSKVAIPATIRRVDGGVVNVPTKADHCHSVKRTYIKVNSGVDNAATKVNSGVDNAATQADSGVKRTYIEVDSGVVNAPTDKNIARATIQQKLKTIFKESSSSDDDTPLSALCSAPPPRASVRVGAPPPRPPVRGGAPPRAPVRGGAPPPAPPRAPPVGPLRRRILSGTLARIHKQVYTTKSAVGGETPPQLRVIKLNPHEMKELLSYNTLEQSFTFGETSGAPAPAPAPPPPIQCGPNEPKIFKASDIERWRTIIDRKIVALAKADATQALHTPTSALERDGTSLAKADATQALHTPTSALERDGTSLAKADATQALHTPTSAPERDGTSLVASTSTHTQSANDVEPDSVESSFVIENVVSLSSHNDNDNSTIGNVDNSSSRLQENDTPIEEQTYQNDNDIDINENQNENDNTVIQNDNNIIDTQNENHLIERQSNNDENVSQNENSYTESENDNNIIEMQNQNNIIECPNNNDINKSPNENDTTVGHNDNDIIESQNENNTSDGQNKTEKEVKNDDSQRGDNDISYGGEMEMEPLVATTDDGGGSTLGM